MPTDREFLKTQQAGALTASGAVTAIDEVDYAHAKPYFFDKAADDAMASTTTAETFTGIYFPRKVRLLSVTYNATTGGITADASNFATVTVSKRDSAAANLTTIATLTTTIASSGNITQGAGKALVPSAANVVIAAGSTVTFSVAKTGSGVVVRAGRFTIHATEV